MTPDGNPQQEVLVQMPLPEVSVAPSVDLERGPEAEAVESATLRFRIFINGVVLPLICVGISAFDAVPLTHQIWQSGTLEPYAALLLHRESLVYFWPMILFSSTALAVWCFRPDFEMYAIVRAAIYSGALVATQFLIVSLPVYLLFPVFASAAFAPGLVLTTFLVRLGMPNTRRFTIGGIMLVTTITAMLCALVVAIGAEFSVLNFLTLIAFTAIAATPFLCPVVYIGLAVAVAKRQRQSSIRNNTTFQRSSLIWGVAVISWLVAWVVAWRFALVAMYREYALLPTQAPNCYVSTAAAKGHRLLVRCETTQTSAGIIQVNRQMRRLKLLEFALASGFPRVHRIVRCLYNRLGPLLASICNRSPWLADVAYLSLLPLEACAECLRRWAGVSLELLDQAWRSTSGGPKS